MFSILTQFHNASSNISYGDSLTWPDPGTSYYAYSWNPWQYGAPMPGHVEVKTPDVSDSNVI